jgi:hypothetical protein
MPLGPFACWVALYRPCDGHKNAQGDINCPQYEPSSPRYHRYSSFQGFHVFPVYSKQSLAVQYIQSGGLGMMWTYGSLGTDMVLYLRPGRKAEVSLHFLRREKCIVFTETLSPGTFTFKLAGLNTYIFHHLLSWEVRSSENKCPGMRRWPHYLWEYSQIDSNIRIFATHCPSLYLSLDSIHIYS